MPREIVEIRRPCHHRCDLVRSKTVRSGKDLRTIPFDLRMSGSASAVAAVMAVGPPVPGNQVLIRVGIQVKGCHGGDATHSRERDSALDRVGTATLVVVMASGSSATALPRSSPAFVEFADPSNRTTHKDRSRRVPASVEEEGVSPPIFKFTDDYTGVQ